MVNTKQKKTTQLTKQPSRLNFSAHIDDKDAVADVAAALGIMVQRGINTGLRGSIEGLLNAIGRGEVAIVKIVPQDDGPIPWHLEQYRLALGVAESNAKRAAKRAKAARRLTGR
jgi:hypothetical protein